MVEGPEQIGSGDGGERGSWWQRVCVNCVLLVEGTERWGPSDGEEKVVCS